MATWHLTDNSIMSRFRLLEVCPWNTNSTEPSAVCFILLMRNLIQLINRSAWIFTFGIHAATVSGGAEDSSCFCERKSSLEQYVPPLLTNDGLLVDAWKSICLSISKDTALRTFISTMHKPVSSTLTESLGGKCSCIEIFIDQIKEEIYIPYIENFNSSK